MIRSVLNTVLFFTIILSTACNSPEPQLVMPSNIIREDSMVRILVDIHLLEASINMGLLNNSVSSTQSDKVYNVFKKHSTTRQQYDSSMNFYSSNPQLLNKIYEQVIASLSQKQAELNR